MALARAAAAKEASKRQEEDFQRITQLLKLKVLKPGDAVNFPQQGDSCSIHCAGYLENGMCFDNSFNRGIPLAFILGNHQVLKAFELVLPILSRGEKAEITIPAGLAYGEKGYPPIIPPNATIRYELELLSFSSVGAAERLHRLKKLQEEAEKKALELQDEKDKQLSRWMEENPLPVTKGGKSSKSNKNSTSSSSSSKSKSKSKTKGGDGDGVASNVSSKS